MKFLRRLFRPRTPAAPAPAAGSVADNDMRLTPIDNPLDYRPDGSIREGDPAWALVEMLTSSGGPVSGRQRPDGTWELTSHADQPPSR